MSQLLNDRLVLNDLNARSAQEVIDNINDRTIITTNSANILNIMAETLTVNPEEEVIRKRGRKKTPKISLLPLRRSPRKAPNPSSNSSDLTSQLSTNSDQTHDYFLRTPKKTPQKSSTARTPSKQTPSKSSSMSIRRCSPRKRLQLDNNDSGIGLSPAALNCSLSTPNMSASEKKSSLPKSKSSAQSLSMTRRRRRRYF